MSFDAEEFYRLLPAIHRLRDKEAGQPLRQFIALIASQVAVIDDNLDQLYDNHFVETAASWALPYLGDLLGIRGLPSASLPHSPRAEVGHTIAYRRRKGTAAMLELLARDVTGWPARAVEFFERLAATQRLNHLRPHCRSFASLRDPAALEWIGTPFESTMRTAEVRRIQGGRGRWNIPNIGVFLHRLRAYSHTASPLVPDPLSHRHFRFHPLGFDAPLFTRPETETDLSQLAQPGHVPWPITRRRLASDTVHFHPRPELYGAGRSLVIEEFTERGYLPVAAENVAVCDLSDVLNADGNVTAWAHSEFSNVDLATPHSARIRLDPTLGRVVFRSPPADTAPRPRASFHLGFSFDLGGGEYARTASFESTTVPSILVPRSDGSTLRASDTLDGALAALPPGPGNIEITTNGRLELTTDIDVRDATREIRAADGTCPVVILRPPASGEFRTLRGEAAGRATLNGLWLAGPWQVRGNLGQLRLRHCTLAPGWSAGPEGPLLAEPDAHLRIDAARISVEIENSILPALRVGPDTVRVHLRNCIIDAGSESGLFALSNLDGNGPSGTWRLENCTVIGRVSVEILELASNCIFAGESVEAVRLQTGCVRFSALPPDSRVPRRHRCVPGEVGGSTLRPQFTSLRFGSPGYAQLSNRCPREILTGADDGAEMGVFHDLFQPQRHAHLLARLSESLRVGLEAGVFHAS